jgi:hypothetical protein
MLFWAITVRSVNWPRALWSAFQVWKNEKKAAKSKIEIRTQKAPQTICCCRFSALTRNLDLLIIVYISKIQQKSPMKSSG